MARKYIRPRPSNRDGQCDRCVKFGVTGPESMFSEGDLIWWAPGCGANHSPKSTCPGAQTPEGKAETAANERKHRKTTGGKGRAKKAAPGASQSVSDPLAGFTRAQLEALQDRVIDKLADA